MRIFSIKNKQTNMQVSFQGHDSEEAGSGLSVVDPIQRAVVLPSLYKKNFYLLDWKAA